MSAPSRRALKQPEPAQKPEVTEEQKTNPHISLRDFFAYLGPTLIISLAYIDPGNFGTGIAGGSTFDYGLLWAVWMAGLMAMVLQYMSGKLGIATGNSLAQMVRSSLKSRSRVISYWLAGETAIAATDLAEYLGTVIALNIFGVPLLDAAFLGALDTIVLLFLLNNRFRVLEYFFMLFVSIISLGFLYQLLLVGPNLGKIAVGSLSPVLTGGANGTVLVVVGIVGATVMPHVLWLHSSLTQTKTQRWGVKEGDLAPRKKMLRLHLRENVVILAIASCVNAGILIVAAKEFYPSSIQDVKQAYDLMVPLVGPFAAVIFAVTLLSSGIASSTVGTLAGQELMTSMLGIKVNPYLRRVITRVINVFPTTIAIYLGLAPFVLLFYSQVLLSLFIPLPMVPLVYYTSKRKVMGAFVNRWQFAVLAVAVAGTIIALNVALLFTSL